MHSSFPNLSRNLVKEPFHDPVLSEAVWGERWGMDNPVGQIRKVLVHSPGKEVLKLHKQAGKLESGPAFLHEIKGKSSIATPSPLPELSLLQQQHKALVTALKQQGVEIVFLEGPADELPEAMFTRDLGMVIPGGIILSRFALYIRYGETRCAAQTMHRIGMPVLGMVQGTGFAEGGSFIMIDPHTAAIGRSERVNPEGIDQIRRLLSIQGIQLLAVDLPASIIHMDEAFLMVDQQKAMVNTALLPFWFLDELHQRKIEMLHVDPRDPLLTINALAISPGKVLLSSDGPYTMELLSRNGVQVISVDTTAIQKLGGGIHCCTLPLIRDSLA